MIRARGAEGSGNRVARRPGREIGSVIGTRGSVPKRTKMGTPLGDVVASHLRSLGHLPRGLLRLHRRVRADRWMTHGVERTEGRLEVLVFPVQQVVHIVLQLHLLVGEVVVGIIQGVHLLVLVPRGPAVPFDRHRRVRVIACARTPGDACDACATPLWSPRRIRKESTTTGAAVGQTIANGQFPSGPLCPMSSPSCPSRVSF